MWHFTVAVSPDTWNPGSYFTPSTQLCMKAKGHFKIYIPLGGKLYAYFYGILTIFRVSVTRVPKIIIGTCRKTREAKNGLHYEYCVPFIYIYIYTVCIQTLCTRPLSHVYSWLFHTIFHIICLIIYTDSRIYSFQKLFTIGKVTKCIKRICLLLM